MGLFKGEAGDGAAGDIFVWDRRHVWVGDILETTDAGGQDLRWVVEQTFVWLDGFSRLARNYEQTTESAEEFIDFASISILIKHL